MIKYVLFLFSLVFLIFFTNCSTFSQTMGIGDQTYDPENWVIYNDSVQLNISDFKASPSIDSKGNYYSYMQIVSIINCKDGNVGHKSYAAFNKNKSWIRNTKDTFLLKKQQLRFKLYQFYAMNLDHKIKEQIHSCREIKSKRDVIGKQNFLELSDFERKIDLEFNRLGNSQELYDRINTHIDHLLSKDNKDSFYVQIEQNGKKVPIKDHVVELEKKPFTIVIGMKNLDGLLLSCSKTDASYNLFKNDSIKIKNIPAYENTGMAEPLFNKDKDVIVCHDAPSYWYYDDESSHRFNKVDHKDGWIIGKRVIESFSDFDSRKLIKIKHWNADLYFTFLHYTEGEDFLDRIPVQKEYFIIKWK